ncbi:hypothetical protein BC829DRAFT_62713 [Chytridium lagenaria]|nr:hypothetical protein BC829DRAFT_62713 [Chytridium lagenaria]
MSLQKETWFKSKVLKDTKVVATRLDEVSALAQECRRLVSDVSQKEAQHGADMTKVLKEISSIKAQLAERKTSEIELRTRLESVSSDGGRVKDKISDVLEFEQRVQKRLDIHVVTLENLRQEIKTLKEDQKSKFEHSPIAIAGVKADLLEDILRIEKDLEQKVDTAVVEELMRHLATRDEVSNILKNVSRELTSENRINESYRTDLSEHILNNVREHMDALGNTISSTLYDKLSHDLHDEIRQFERDISTSRPSKENRTESHKSEKFMSEIGALRSKLDRHMHAVQGEITRISKTLDKRRDIEIPSPVSDSPSLSEARHVDLDIATSDKLVKAISESLARDFDEKFFLLCADLSACKAAYQAAASQPFFKCGQWLWRSNQLRQGSSIPWNYETVNTDPDNFRWEQDQTFVRVAEAGLYEITFAFFTQSRPSIQLVVNGESVLSAINSPTYVVHHGSGFVNDGGGKIEPGSITGISLIDFLALPAKSTISLHFHSSKKNQACHGFLGLKRL